VFEVELILRAENLGTVSLAGVQIVDNLAETFPAPASLAVLSVSSPTLTVNGQYDGIDDDELLTGDDVLAPGASAEVSVRVAFSPNGATSPFFNSATVSADGAATDVSHDGEDSDPEGDGPADNSAPTPIEFDDTPAAAFLGLAKTASEPVLSADSSQTFETILTFTARNYGDTPLSGLQITDNLAVTFPQPATFEVLAVSSETLAPNPGFDGAADPNVLSGIDTLPAGGSAVVMVTVGFSAANGENGTFLNTAVASTTTPGIPPDDSHDGDDPDPEGDGPGDNDTPTTIPVPGLPTPVIGLAKAASDVAFTAEGRIRARLTLVVQNPGEEALAELQVTDNLVEALAPGVVTDVRDLALLEGDVVLNSEFNGAGEDALLAAGQMLAAGAAVAIAFTVEFDPGDGAGPFFNTATARGVGSLSGQPVEDTSTNGLDPDPDTPGEDPTDNPDPGDDDEPTPIEPPAGAASLGLAKAAGETTVAGDSGQIFETTLTFTASNLGNTDLAGLQVSDDLSAVFAAPATFEVLSLSSQTLTVNPLFNGASEVDLLTGTDSLAVGASATIELRIGFSPNGFLGPFLNIAVGSSTTPDTPDDESTNGTDPDPEGNGPGDNDEPTPITFVASAGASPALVLSKTADRREAAVGEFVGYEVRVDLVMGPSDALIELVDRIPGGFQYVAGSAQLVRAGSDGRLGNADDIVAPLDSNGANAVAFAQFTMDPETAVLVRYATRVGPGVGVGSYVNTVDGNLEGIFAARDEAEVLVVTDPVFERTTIIGKVFDDRDGDGRQGQDELGVAGARLATVGGLLIETDDHGRFHIADVDVPRFERGSNFILKLDHASLPHGTTIVPRSNPRVIRLTQALMTSIDFPVQLPAAHPGFADADGGETAAVEFTTRTRRELVASVNFARLTQGELAQQMTNAPAALAALARYLQTLPPDSNVRVD
ncbi:MAG: hypothetical protein OES38_20015, partial [Gammaproteobacteria bacterium]|nr:hypothetical protein [Gammaproteobacteria bacterium]